MHRAVLEEAEVLEDYAELAAQHRHLAARHAVRPGDKAGDPDLALARPLVEVQQLEQRALARATRPRQEHELPFRDLQRQVVDGPSGAREFLGYVPNADHGRPLT